MTNTEQRTMEAADHILTAPDEWIRAEPPACLAEILEVFIEHLGRIQGLGAAMRAAKLKQMQKKWLTPDLPGLT